MHLIGCFYLILNQGFTDTMQSPHCLLRFRSGCTKRIDGRDAASQIASASTKSFLLLLTNGRTNCGDISWGMPNSSNLRAIKRTATGFHCDGCSGACRQKFDQLWPGKFFTVNSLPATILAMNMERVFTQMGSSQKTESMVTPVFATPILTTSWLA
jgi:hypothetical protein